MTTGQNGKQPIVLTNPDGTPCTCQLLDRILYNERTYALLLVEEDQRLLILRETRVGDQVCLESIEDDAEFEEVTTYIKFVAQNQ
jgi:hypothetical protein